MNWIDSSRTVLKPVLEIVPQESYLDYTEIGIIDKNEPGKTKVFVVYSVTEKDSMQANKLLSIYKVLPCIDGKARLILPKKQQGNIAISSVDRGNKESELTYLH